MKLHAGNSVYLTELKLATRYGIGYLHEPLFTIQRPARQNIGDALAHYFQLYLDKCNFTRQATIDGMKELDATCAEAIGELAKHPCREKSGALSDGCLVSAKQWFHLATAMAPKIEQEEAFQSLAADLERTADITREKCVKGAEMTRTPDATDTQNPLVSVLVFNYNYDRFLRECFDSVLRQTYPNVEICFSDNASNDDSWLIYDPNTSANLPTGSTFPATGSTSARTPTWRTALSANEENTTCNYARTTFSSPNTSSAA